MRSRTITVIVIIIILVFMIIIPKSWFQEFYAVPCYHKKLTGIQCPLCGLTSATYKLIHFNVKRALELNFVVLPLSLLIISEIVFIFRKAKIVNILSKIFLFATIAGLIIIYAIRIFSFLYKG